LDIHDLVVHPTLDTSGHDLPNEGASRC